MGVLPWTCRCGLNPSPSKNRGASARPPPPAPRAKKSKYTGQSVRTMPMRVLTVGKKRSQGTQLLVDEYKEKLGHYCDIEDSLIKSNPKLTSDVKVQIEAEDTSMMQQLKPEDFVVVLDENGKDVMSEQIADLIGDAGNTVGHMVLGYKYENGRMQQLGYPHWSPGRFNSSNGAALQGMDNNQRTEVSPLDWSCNSIT